MLKRFGFRIVLIANALLAALSTGSAFFGFSPATRSSQHGRVLMVGGSSARCSSPPTMRCHAEVPTSHEPRHRACRSRQQVSLATGVARRLRWRWWCG
jgi:hypothetical protein